MKYSIIGFWENYDYNNNIFTNLLCKNHELIIDITMNLSEHIEDKELFSEENSSKENNNIDFIIIGCFIYDNLYNIINNFH